MENLEEKIFGKSYWIWPDNPNWDIHNGYALFRHSFQLPSVPARAPLFITADHSYQLHINGRYVCRGPARGFQAHWPYDEVDVQSWLRKGRNVIAVRAYNPGYSNFQYVTEGTAGFLLAARWGKTEIVSDTKWKSKRQEGIHRGTVPVSVQLFGQEHIDLRLESPDWVQPDFDDSGWRANTYPVPWNAMPWYRLEKRGIPMLEEKIVLPVAVQGIQEGASAPEYLAARDVSLLFHEEGLSHQPASFEPSNFVVEPTGAGQFRRILLDFGHTVVGSLGLKISGAQGGEIIDSLHVETIDPETLALSFQHGLHSKMAFSHRLICRAGENEHVFHHPFGFRYMALTVRDSAAPLRLQPYIRSTVYPMEIKGAFRSSDADLNEIWDTCAWTQRVCSLDSYVDTPWREQAQWWGDARVQAWNTFHLSGDPRLFRRGIAQIAAQTTPNGLTYGHAPTMAHNCILPDFSLIWILTLWDYYWQTGSTEPIEVHGKIIDGLLEYFQKTVDSKTGLLRFDPRYWLFLDWTDIQREGCPALLSLWLLLALEKLEILYKLRNDSRRKLFVRRWATQLRQALAGLIDGQGLMHDGFDPEGKRVPATSIHCQVLALMGGLKSMSKERVLSDVLLPYIREEKDFTAKPSAYWITYVFSLLQQYGHGAEVLASIRRYWTPMSAHGTTWENFAPRKADESFSHAWSAHPLYHLDQILGGVTQTAPKWSAIRFAPQFLIDSCETVIPTPAGLIRSRWKKSKGRIKVELKLPAGTTAEISLPGEKSQRIRGTQSWLLTSP